MKNINAYNNFLEHGVLYPSKHWLEYNYNNKDVGLFPEQVGQKRPDDLFSNFTKKGYTLGAVTVMGSTNGVYYNATHPYKGKAYEVYAYDFVDENNINVTKIDANMHYRKNILGKENFKKPVIKITSIKVSKVNKDSDNELYEKIMEIVNKVEGRKKIVKRDLEYALKHSGEEYERELRRDYWGSQWR